MPKRKWRCFLFFGLNILLIFFQNCDRGLKSQTSDKISISSPVLGSNDSNGIIEAPQPVSAHLAWDPSVDSKVQGYQLKYGEQSGQYTKTINVNKETDYVVNNLEKGKTYYFVVISYSSENESPISNEIKISSE